MIRFEKEPKFVLEINKLTLMCCWCAKKKNNNTENGKKKTSAILFFELEIILVNIG